MTLKSRIISSIIICLSVLIYNAALMITATAYNVNLYVKIFCFLLNAPLIIATVCAVALNYRQLARWLISISILLAISAIVYYIILRYDLYSKFDSADKIQDFLSKYGDTIFASHVYTVAGGFDYHGRSGAIWILENVFLQRYRHNQRLYGCILSRKALWCKTIYLALRQKFL